MIFSSLLIEIFLVLVMVLIIGSLWRTGKRAGLANESGWKQILGGFCLLLFGALVDVSDHFPSLSPLLIFGQTPYQAVAEKLVGFLGGYCLLAIGFWRWFPHVIERRRIEQEMRRSTEELQLQVQKGSAELNLKQMDLAREIRQRRLATSALRRSRELLEKVVSSAPIALLACGVDGEVTLAQGRALAAVGFEKEGFGSVSETSVSLLERFPQIGDNFAQALQGEASTSLLVIGARTFEFLHSPWIAEDDELLGVVTVGSDVTELHRAHEDLKVAKEAAEESSRTKSLFLANMSHELRTPLNSVIGFANILLKNKEQSLGDRELRFLDRIRDNGQHLLTLINEILDLSRIESGRIELLLEEVDVPALIHDTVTQLRTETEDHDVEVRSRIPAAAKTVLTDPLKLRQVLINLLGNALKFTEKGYVEVRLRLDDEGTPRRIEVRDTGRGIPAQNLQSIFNAFEQLEGDPTNPRAGSGLGLSISRSLCQLLDFSLHVKSKVGIGSTFWIDLVPRQGAEGHGNFDSTSLADSGMFAEVQMALKAAQQPVRRAAQFPGQRVLVIDDSLESRLLMLEMLEEMGCEASAVASGEEGLLVARKRRPDLIVLDLMMPQMDGWEVLSQLREDAGLASIPILVASIMAEEKRGTLVGSHEVLNKPFSRQQLEEMLTRLLQRDEEKPSRSILVVDDEEMVRHLLSELLLRRGFRVTTLATAKEAIERLEEEAFDLLLVDLVMPQMGGQELVDRLRANPRWSDLPVVVVTGMTLKDSERRVLESKVSGILPKGYDLEEDLQRLVDEVLG